MKDELVERDIYEVSNQLLGWIGPDTDDGLCRFLAREGKAAGELARRIESLEASLERAEEERRIVLQNKRVNDAVQTALERDELSISSEGWLQALKEISQ